MVSRCARREDLFRGALFAEDDPSLAWATDIVNLAHWQRTALLESQRLAEIKDILFVNLADSYGSLGSLKSQESVVLRHPTQQTLHVLGLNIKGGDYILHHRTMTPDF